jgi:hypothetical protein
VRVTSTTAARRSSRRSTRWVGSRRIPSRSNRPRRSRDRICDGRVGELQGRAAADREG